MTAATRDPAGFATYPGDATAMLGEFKGPDYRGRLLLVAGAEYDAAADHTHIAFVYASDDDIAAALKSEGV